MSTGSPKRHRSNLTLPPGQFERTLEHLRRGDVLVRIGLCLLAAVAMWLLTFGWRPPFAYRTGDVPPRDIVARTDFHEVNEKATELAMQDRREATVCVYQHDVRPLMTSRQALKDSIFQVIHAESFETLDKNLWNQFLTESERDQADAPRETFTKFKDALSDDLELSKFEPIVKRAFEIFEANGLLNGAVHDKVEGDRFFIKVHPIGNEVLIKEVEIKDVRTTEAMSTLRHRLVEEFKTAMIAEEHAQAVSHHVLQWISNNGLPTTLTLNVDATNRAKHAEVAKVEPILRHYGPGKMSDLAGDKLASGGKRLKKQNIDLLRLEYEALNANMTLGNRAGHFFADLGMYAALYILCGFFIYYREPSLLDNMRRFVTLLAMVVITVGLCSFLSFDELRAEIIPLLMFGITIALAYRQELALLLSSSVALAVVLSLGQGLFHFVIYVATVASAIQLLDRIRSRTKLIYIGACAGLVAALTTIGVGTVSSQVFGESLLSLTSSDPGFTFWDSAGWALLFNSARYGFYALLGGLLMTAILPFIEKIYDVQTDISLLELGDAAHPLLQELVRRAPGTYNHSINVASIAEAAADSIGANGLLCRVGAYFHDIGKMLKPSYFAENQNAGVNRHESLVPAMSTLVIIAHVKDGADLARQHRLPQSIINFIEQHHGTTLVEYFFDQAARQKEADPDGGEIEEANFRYPGPKPQIKETGVMMLADALESASRTLVDPTPARIESLVHDILMKRLLDGQFDECGLTLKELHIVEQSLVKSLIAVYHGRVKYPQKQHTA